MAILPGWNSIETVSKIHRWLEIAGIICLAALVVTEVFAHVYGRRKDVLAEGIETKQRDQAQAKERDLNSRLDKVSDEAREAKEQQVAAEKELSKLRASAEPRNLQGTKRANLIRDLAQHPGFVNYLSSVSDGEATSLARQILEILPAAGWGIGTYAQTSVGAVGQGIIYSIPNPEHPTDSEHALITAFGRAGLRLTVNQGTGRLIVGFRAPD